MTARPPIRVLGISGSLRKASYNTALLRAAIELAPEGMVIEAFDLAPIPFFDDDVYKVGFPDPVRTLRERVSEADAVVFATPEYNYSIPGVLKNAIDWVSRPPDQPFAKKPSLIMGATTGGFGTVRSQLHLRHVMVFLDMAPLNKPEVLVARAQEKFDATGRLTDEKTRAAVREGLAALAARVLSLHASVHATSSTPHA